MTRNETRNEATREAKVRRTTFEEPNWLDIPVTVVERFKNQGMALRWIRISLKGNDDVQNVGKRLNEGWEFVSTEEAPEMIQSSVVRENGRYSGTICRGDLALAKMPQELAESRQEFYENRSREMVDAVLRSLRRTRAPDLTTSGETPALWVATAMPAGHGVA